MATIAEPGVADVGEARIPTPPPLRVRILVALVIGVASAVAITERVATNHRGGDFDQLWFSARALWAGQNPYLLVGPGLAFNWNWPLFYPATAIVAVSPLAPFPLVLARALFVGGSAALLAYGITRESWARMPLFLSASFLFAVSAAQWSPLLTAAACTPALAFIVAAKPNLGLAVIAKGPSAGPLRYAAAGSVVLFLVSFALLPSWPGEWLALVHEGSFAAPITHPAGFALALATLRWRRPDARLLLALACIPHTTLLYAALPLFLIPVTVAESALLAVLSWMTLAGWHYLIQGVSYADGVTLSARLELALLYLPCLLMVLRRPNE